MLSHWVDGGRHASVFVVVIVERVITISDSICTQLSKGRKQFHNLSHIFPQYSLSHHYVMIAVCQVLTPLMICLSLLRRKKHSNRIGAIVNASQQFLQPYETSDAHTLEGNNANTEEFEMVEPPVSFRDGPSTSFMEVVVTAGPISNSTSNGNMSWREE